MQHRQGSKGQTSPPCLHEYQELSGGHHSGCRSWCYAAWASCACHCNTTIVMSDSQQINNDKITTALHWQQFLTQQFNDYQTTCLRAKHVVRIVHITAQVHNSVYNVCAGPHTHCFNSHFPRDFWTQASRLPLDFHSPFFPTFFLLVQVKLSISSSVTPSHQIFPWMSSLSTSIAVQCLT